jgi:uncharacterized membrane protein
MKMRIPFLARLVLFCALLIIVRFYKTGHYSFIFLFWNLFLAWLPLFFARKLNYEDGKIKRFLLLGVSVLFLPNAPYILTDLFHLKKSLVAPLWFDLILILSFAILGMLYFILALDLIFKEVSRSFAGYVQRVFKPMLFLSTGYGIYLGRYLRYNSWDVLSQPVELAGGIFNSIFNSSCYKETCAVTITFTVFLYLVYEIYLSFKNQNLNPAS